MVDKESIQQVLGCLMKHPQFLSEVDKYRFELSDFSTRFERYIFTAIYGLYYDQGLASINVFDIENYLKSDPVAKQLFEQQKGIEYLQDIEDFCNADNFSYYYNKLKKCNLLRDLKKMNIGTDDFYVDDLTNERALEVNSGFEKLSTKDIIDGVKKKLLKVEANYVQTDEVQVECIADGIEDFLEELATTVDIGPPIQGEIYSKIIDGAQPGALTIRSGSSGLGKTRQAVGDACLLAYPLRYNSATCMWEQTGSNKKILFIVTEQTFKQVKKMILAYLTDINESKFKTGRFNDRERDVINKAIRIIKEYEDNFILIKIPNPTIELVKNIVRENCLTKNIEHVFYDYVFIGPALLNEFRGFNLRNDEILLMFTTALKDLAVELNISMMTSTQVNASADDNKNIRNEASLAGGRATINKADNGCIMARPTKEEIDILKEIISKYGEPNMVTDIFKVRSGEWTQVRIWSYVNLGTMKKRDLFITDSRLDTIDNFFDEDVIVVKNWEESEEVAILNMVKEFNGL